MPRKLKSPCSHPGCPEVTRERFCPEHKKEHYKQQNRERDSPSRQGYGYRWRKARAHFLKRNPLCVQCLEEGKTTAATVVDHITPHRGDMELFWDRNNWQPLCGYHHGVKTAKETWGKSDG